MRGWAPEVTVHAELHRAPCCTADEVLFAIGLCPRDAIDDAFELIHGAAAGALAIARYSFGDGSTWALRIAPAGCSEMTRVVAFGSRAKLGYAAEPYPTLPFRVQ
jgi:hypothetical protein